MEVPQTNLRLRMFLSASVVQSPSVEQASPLLKAQEQHHSRVSVANLLFQLSRASEDNSHNLQIHSEHKLLSVELAYRVLPDRLLHSAVEQLPLANLPAPLVLVLAPLPGQSKKHLKLPQHAHQ